MTSGSTSREMHPLVRDIHNRFGLIFRLLVQYLICDGEYERSKGFMRTHRKICDEPIELARNIKAYVLNAQARNACGIKGTLKTRNGTRIAERIALACYCYLPTEKSQSLDEFRISGKRLLLTERELSAFPGLKADNIQGARYVLDLSPAGELRRLCLVMADTSRANARTIVSNAKKALQQRFVAEPLDSRKSFEDVILRDRKFAVVVVTNNKGKAFSIQQEFDLGKAEAETAWEHVGFEVVYHEFYEELCPTGL